MYSLKIEIEMLPKSLNKKLRANRFKNHKENLMFDRVVYFKCLGKLPAKPLLKAEISITRHFYRLLDFDNCVGSLKPVVDALVSCGVLSDDNWNVLGAWKVDQKFRSKSDGPLIEIEIIEKA